MKSIRRFDKVDYFRKCAWRRNAYYKLTTWNTTKINFHTYCIIFVICRCRCLWYDGLKKKKKHDNNPLYHTTSIPLEYKFKMLITWCPHLHLTLLFNILCTCTCILTRHDIYHKMILQSSLDENVVGHKITRMDGIRLRIKM